VRVFVQMRKLEKQDFTIINKSP